MKVKIFLLILLVLPFVTKAECGKNINQLKAEYQITIKKITKQGVSAVDSKSIVFWRNGKEVAYQHINKNITEIWNKVSNGRVRPVRYFDEYQHGIEYQPTELERQDRGASWQTKYQILSSNQLNQMKQVAKQGKGCEQTVEYRSQQEFPAGKLIWLSMYQLPKYYDVKTATHLISWELKSLDTSSDVVKAFFKEKHSYKTTDFADIGDNESDPFLIKMINLGFVSEEVSEPTKAKQPDRHAHSH